jgi:membrane protease YdiL (CAAX protease family)
MSYPSFNILEELKKLFKLISELDKKIIIIFISVAILQTISWYYTSRRFFRFNLFDLLHYSEKVYLIEYFYWYLSDFITLFILPLLIIKFLLKEKISDYGLKAGDYKAGLSITLIFVVVMAFFIWLMSASKSFGYYYPPLNLLKTSWGLFYLYLAGLFIYMIAWEFIWRGFMLFGLEEKFGYYSILIQMIPFLILHNGKPAVETFGAIIAGLALGILAFRTRSIFYCVITHFCVMFSINFISILRFRAGDYGVGFGSLFHILGKIF